MMLSVTVILCAVALNLFIDVIRQRHFTLEFAVAFSIAVLAFIAGGLY